MTSRLPSNPFSPLRSHQRACRWSTVAKSRSVLLGTTLVLFSAVCGALSFRQVEPRGHAPFPDAVHCLCSHARGLQVGGACLWLFSLPDPIWASFFLQTSPNPGALGRFFFGWGALILSLSVFELAAFKTLPSFGKCCFGISLRVGEMHRSQKLQAFAEVEPWAQFSLSPTSGFPIPRDSSGTPRTCYHCLRLLLQVPNPLGPIHDHHQSLSPEDVPRLSLRVGLPGCSAVVSKPSSVQTERRRRGCKGQPEDGGGKRVVLKK